MHLRTEGTTRELLEEELEGDGSTGEEEASGEGISLAYYRSLFMLFFFLVVVSYYWVVCLCFECCWLLLLSRLI